MAAAGAFSIGVVFLPAYNIRVIHAHSFVGAAHSAAAAAAWQRLARFLAGADGPQHGWRLHVAALRAALAADRRLQPPPWLLRAFQVRRAAPVAVQSFATNSIRQAYW